MIILHINSIKKPEGNGVAEAIKCYSYYEGINNTVAVYSLNKSLGLKNMKEFCSDDYSAISQLPEPFNEPDLIVFNEVYKLEYLRLYKECSNNGIPYVIIPHGCLVNIAQKKRKIKKIVGNFLFFNRFIRRASAIQFLNKEEKESTKFKYNKYIISGNGIELHPSKRISPKNNDLIYIGRYSIYHKGLDLLVDICHRNKEWFINNHVQIRLFGRPSRADLDELNKMTKKLGVSTIVNINGPVYGEDKIKILKESYGFIQVSRHEGQPMGIIEALAYGLPCIVTTGTNFKDYVNNNKCGYGVDFNDKQIMDAIKELYRDRTRRNEMSNNALKCAAESFKWNSIIDKLLDDYNDLIETEKK